MKFGLIGHNISHSLSPLLFEAGYGGKHVYDLIDEADFEKGWQRFIEGYDAVNVTAPFKELACRKADIRLAECEATGAANILFKQDDGRIVAANSDIAGVSGAITAGLHQDGETIRTALVVGCGGAGKAAAYALGKKGYRTIIINRDFDKARNYADKLHHFYGMNVRAYRREGFRKWFRRAGIIVYAVPAAIPQLADLSRADIRGGFLFNTTGKVIIEANYKDPAFTPELIGRMQKINPKLSHVGGKEWLLHQAIGAYVCFLKEEPDMESMRLAIR